MKNTISTICFCIISIIGYSQVWTEPVNISNMHAFIQSSDFCIDNSGVFHCVWNKTINDNHSVLFYSKSQDQGFTWSEPENISQNSSRYYINPKILSDSENNLYVAFDNYNFSPPDYSVYVSVISYTNNLWNEVQNISIGLNTFIIIDDYNRLYCFWSQGGYNNGEFAYQYFDEGVWSDTFVPFDDDTTLAVLTDAKADSFGNLHCVGIYDSTATSIRIPAYFYYNYETQTWDDIALLSDVNSLTTDLDIAIANTQNPLAIWNEPEPVISYFNGDFWNPKQEVCEIESHELQVELDENSNPLIIVTYSNNNEMYIDCCYLCNDIVWIKSTIDSSLNAIFKPQLIMWNDYSYLVYQKSDTPQDADIYFCKTDLQLSLYDYENRRELTVYPNPFSSEIYFNWGAVNPGNMSECYIQIYNEFGKNVHSKYIHAGVSNSYIWDGKDSRGNNTDSGIYFCEVIFDDIKKSIKFIKY